LPVHIHVAEQRLEVEACVRWRPAAAIELLLDTIGRPTLCLVHATHATAGN